MTVAGLALAVGAVLAGVSGRSPLTGRETGTPVSPAGTIEPAEPVEPVAPPAAPVEPPPAVPTDPAFYDAMVTDRTDGWLAADLVTSVVLPDRRVLWLFGDTDWGTRARSGAYAGGWHMTTNSAIVQDGVVTRALGRDGGFVPPGRYGPRDRLYWPAAAVMAGDHLHVIFNRIRIGDLVRERSELVDLTLPDLRPVGMQVLPDGGRQWSQSATVAGGWVYYHGLVGTSSLLVARAPETAPLDLAYWTGATWSTDPEAAAVVLPEAENGVVRRLPSGTWVALSKPFLGTDVIGWTAPAPTGPFTRLARPVAPAVPAGAGSWLYMASLVPLGGGTHLLVVNENNAEAARVRAGTAYYGPHFSTAPALDAAAS